MWKDSPDELQAVIWAGWGGKGEAKVAKERKRYKKNQKSAWSSYGEGPWDLWPSQTSSWWLVWTQMSLSPPQISCWSSSGGFGDGGKSRNAPVQFIAQNGNPNRAWAAQGSLGSPYLGSWAMSRNIGLAGSWHWLSWTAFGSKPHWWQHYMGVSWVDPHSYLILPPFLS